MRFYLWRTASASREVTHNPSCMTHLCSVTKKPRSLLERSAYKRPHSLPTRFKYLCSMSVPSESNGCMVCNSLHKQLFCHNCVNDKRLADVKRFRQQMSLKRSLLLDKLERKLANKVSLL